MKNFIILIIFSLSLSLYGGSDLFPFGMNYSVYEKFHPLPEDEEYREKYKTSMDLCTKAGIKWWRPMFAFTWYSVQDSIDENYWNFDTEDSLVKWCGERGLYLLPSIGYTTEYAWHSSIKDIGKIDSENKNRYPPDPTKWGAYKKYVDTLVKRYKNDIKYWECMNEPYGEYFLGTPVQYVGMYDSTWKALKSADPDAKIVGLCMTSYDGTFKWKYFDPEDQEIKIWEYSDWKVAIHSLINSIDRTKIDIVSHHIYNNTPNFMKYTRELDSILKANTYGEGRPIWITETGIKNSSVFKAERGTGNLCDSSSLVTYSSDSGEIFGDWVWVQRDGDVCDTMDVDTFLNVWDTVILEYRKDGWGKDTVIYNGDSLIYEGENDTVTALAIGDTLTIFHCWANEDSIHNDTNQALAYARLLDSIINTPNFLNNLKVFFFCADNDFNEEYYPPKITFGERPPWWQDGGYEVTRYHKQRLHSPWSVIDTLNDPYQAYYTIRDNILLPHDQILQDTAIDTSETKTYQALNSITANTFTIKGNGLTGGKVAMEAGDIIHLQDGFRVEQGGYFYGVTNSRYGGGGGGMSSMKVSMSKAIKNPEDNTPKEDSIPKVFSCAQNYPNPFVQNTTIKYGLPKDVDVQLDIYNLLGQKIRTLVNAKQTAGYKSVSWDGRTSNGGAAPKGIYFYTFKAGDYIKHHKMILIK